jgi:hypothetical protein
MSTLEAQASSFERIDALLEVVSALHIKGLLCL